MDIHTFVDLADQRGLWGPRDNAARRLATVALFVEQGLIAPTRTPTDTYQFQDSDIDRLAGILRLQRSEHLPMAVILERLGAP